MQATYILHEQKKIFSYDQRIREVKHSLFTPCTNPINWVWEELPHLLKRLAAMLNKKREYVATWAYWEPLLCLSDPLQICLEMQLCVCPLISSQIHGPSMIAATFYKHSMHIYIYTQCFRLYVLYLTVNFLITPGTETSVTNVSFARVIKKFTIMSHPSHTGQDFSHIPLLICNWLLYVSQHFQLQKICSGSRVKVSPENTEVYAFP